MLWNALHTVRLNHNLVPRLGELGIIRQTWLNASPGFFVGLGKPTASTLDELGTNPTKRFQNLWKAFQRLQKKRIWMLSAKRAAILSILGEIVIFTKNIFIPNHKPNISEPLHPKP